MPISFGSFSPGDSPLHRLDPRTKLLGGVFFIVIALVARTPAAFVLMGVFVATLYAISRISVRDAARSLAPLLIVVIFASLANLFMVQGGAVLVQLGPVVISEAGAINCATIALRLLLMMMVMSLVTLTTTTLDLSEAFERVLWPFAKIGLPAHELGMLMGIALRFMPQFATEFVTTYRAQISRGARAVTGPISGIRTLTSLMVPLFTSAFRHADTLAGAMDARCYHGADRTRLHPLVFGTRDAAAAALLVALLVAVAVFGFLGV